MCSVHRLGMYSNHWCSVLRTGKQKTSVPISGVPAAFLLLSLFHRRPTIVLVCGCLSNGTVTCELPFGMHFIFIYMFTIELVHIKNRRIANWTCSLSYTVICKISERVGSCEGTNAVLEHFYSCLRGIFVLMNH